MSACPGPIRTITISTTDVEAHVALYERWLGYRAIERGTVPAAQAASWGAPAVAGRPYALLSPEGKGDAYLRFVESRRATGYVPFRHLGWNAAEHIVQDCDALDARLKGSPFEIIGPPADLSFSDQIRAMQIRGPADEVLYLTQFKSKLPGVPSPDAKFPVDRVFIMVLGGRSIASVQDWYATKLGVPRAPEVPSRITVIARAWGHPPDTRYPLAAIPLPGACYIEADAMPDGVLPRPCLPGELPVGIAIVTFEVDALPADLPWFSAPTAFAGLANAGGVSATCVGPAGELLELVARTPA